eukprot:CAMPEP_0113947558 /NCGR_PEP_ID=MMETSP1339-20121228/65428_1 /TAXON_ID=94617 /ORGANISM="Fibrocapsa japonica" /LENGTH=75 /DNA_ID=CAMNT_0000954207 /DNA_START=63 /DNA_END=290 /DNA_ORIENTATION=- /assembly_acc=CAM_ASM_000762
MPPPNLTPITEEGSPMRGFAFPASVPNSATKMLQEKYDGAIRSQEVEMTEGSGLVRRTAAGRNDGGGTDKGGQMV